MNNIIKIKKINEKAIIPTRATEGSAGLDLYACIEEDVVIKPQGLVKIPTGISIQLESNNFGAFIYARSGLGIKYGITLSNGVGVVDSDYRGEICVGLCNVSDKEYVVKSGERVAQMIIMPIVVPQIEEVEEIEESARGEGGFGSTGK